MKRGCILWPFGLLAIGLVTAAGVLLFAPHSSALEEGAVAPGFSLPDQSGKTHSLEDFKGKWVVLAFYPADMTSGCTLQNRSLTSSLDDLRKAGAEVLALSVQDSASHAEFCDAEGLKHTLLADTGKQVSEAYGVLMPVGVSKRVTFVIDPEGKVARRLDSVNVSSHGPDLVALLTDLKAARPESGYRPRTRGIKPLHPGSKAPLFNLPNATGSGSVAYGDLQANKKGVAIIWVSVQCPVSKAYEARMKALAARFASQGIAFVGINSNATESREQTAAHFKQAALGFPVLIDQENVVADAYGALVTPEVFLTDRSGVIRYHGAIDDSQDPAGVKEPFFEKALTALVSGSEVNPNESKAFGCSIKRVKK